MNSILIIDDDPSIRKVLSLRLDAAGYDTAVAPDSQEALRLLHARSFDLALLDLHLGVENGLHVMDSLRKCSPALPIFILTAYGSIESAVDAMKKGAQGYLTKPFDHRELLLQIERCIEKRNLEKEVDRLRGLVKERFGFENIIGKSREMEKVLEKTHLAAGADSVVHIEGESGTGKELIARTLHVASARRDGPFVAINCSAIPESLVESELFGHERGAFTGATQSRQGHFRQADGGSLFLDEISELPLSMQPKLLRVLESRCIQPVGGGKNLNVDVRIITASNKDLREEVERGRFREDLFYRIHVIPIHLPPLRDRKESIPFLARHFLADFTKKMDKKPLRFSSGAMQTLIAYDWPGNVRQLKNTIEYAVAMSVGGVVTEDLLLHITSPPQEKLPTLKETRDRCERDYLNHIIQQTKGNISAAAKLAGKHRADLYSLLHKHGIQPKDFRTDDPSTV